MICLFKNHFIFLPPISNSISAIVLLKKIKKMLNKCQLQNFKTSVKKKTRKRGITLNQGIALENTLPLYASIMGTKMQLNFNSYLAMGN